MTGVAQGDPVQGGSAGTRAGKSAVRAMVLAIGNPLRGDDGVAWRLSEPLRRRPRPGLQLLQRQQLTPELAQELIGVRRLLLVDAWYAPAPAAPQLRRLLPKDRPGGSCRGLGCSHLLDAGSLLQLAAWLYGARPRTSLLLLPIQACPHGEELSPAVQAQLPAARRLLQAWLAAALAGSDAADA